MNQLTTTADSLTQPATYDYKATQLKTADSLTRLELDTVKNQLNIAPV